LKTHREHRRTLRAIAAAVLTVMLGGCIGMLPSPFRPSPGPQKPPQARDIAEAFDIVCRNYRLGPDDQVGVLFSTEWTIPPGSYKLDTLDQIRIKFILDPQLNEDVVIRPDGMITLQAIGEIQAAGLSPSQLAKRIEEKFLEANIFSREETRGDLKNYRLVTVHVVTFYEKVKKLVDSLTSLASGGTSGRTISPDGTLDLPLLKDRILCAGHTIPEVEATINRLYKDIIGHAVVSVSLTSAKSRKFYALGQVGNQGAIDLTQPITILQALAKAGGADPLTADLTSVILISRDAQGKPFGRRIDVKRMLDVGDMSEAILIKPYDVIYVPNTYIRDVRIFIDQYLSVVRDIASFANTLGSK
jgi:protein involved in polysaccharide export with SLBB domain